MVSVSTFNHQTSHLLSFCLARTPNLFPKPSRRRRFVVPRYYLVKGHRTPGPGLDSCLNSQPVLLFTTGLVLILSKRRFILVDFSGVTFFAIACA